MSSLHDRILKDLCTNECADPDIDRMINAHLTALREAGKTTPRIWVRSSYNDPVLYTASVDDALTLMLPSWRMHIASHVGFQDRWCIEAVNYELGRKVESHSTSFAVAICIVALRAIEVTNEET